MFKNTVALFILLTLYFPSYSQANPSELAALINAESQAAFAEIGQQMGIKINLSGKQRMLTQKMSKEALLISRDISPEKNRENLKKSIDLFEKTLLGLKQGDKDLELQKTTNKEIITQLEEVDKLWAAFKPIVEVALTQKPDKKTLDKLAKQNPDLLAAMNTAVEMYAKQGGSDLNDLATVINLSGKQRMLTQKMTKELLLIASDIETKANTKNLKASQSLFGRTLIGLMNGDKKLGLPGTTEKDIYAQLETVETLWEQYNNVLEKVDTSDKGLQEAARLNLPLLTEMNKAVKMYEKLAK